MRKFQKREVADACSVHPQQQLKKGKKIKKPLETFGAFFVQNSRDKMLDYVDGLMRGLWRDKDNRKLQKKISALSEVQKQLIREIAEEIIEVGMHDLLFAIQEQSWADGPIKVMVDGEDVAKRSDGLHGELFSDEGWIVRYSKHPSEKQIEMSRQAEKQITKILEDLDKNKKRKRSRVKTE